MTRASDIRIERFRPAHFALIELQPAQEFARAHTTFEKLAELARSGPAYAVLVDGRVIFCGGIAEFNAELGMLWSFVARHAGPHFVRLHRYVTRFIETVDRPRIVATCFTGFEEGARWLRMLGFTFHQSLGAYGPGGVPHDLYLRVR